MKTNSVSRSLSLALLLLWCGLLILGPASVAVWADAGESTPDNDSVPELIDPVVEDDGLSVEYVPIPVLGRTPELGWIFGLALFIVIQDNPATPASTIAFNGIYTSTGAYALSITPEFYLFDELVQLRSGAAWRSIPSDYFGIGREDRADEIEESYTEEVRELSLNPMFRVSPRARFGPSLRLGMLRADDAESKQKGMLSRLVEDEVPGVDESSVVELGLAYSWDSREPVLDPYYGSSFGVQVAVSNTAIGASYDYGRYGVDVTHIQPLPLPVADHRIAVHGMYEFVEGNAPFQELPKLGGDMVLRGLAEGRYRDYHLAAFQAEYRLPIIWRFGAVLFGGIGQTAPNAESFRSDEWVLAGGGGLRFAVSPAQRLNIRLDIGYSADDGVNVYIGAMEAF